MKRFGQTLACGAAAVVAAALGLGCRSQDVPQAHKGRMFDRTGALAFWVGGKGFEAGATLGPGTYWTGLYDEIRLVNCAIETMKEPMTALTKDGVQFGLDIYIRFAADCSDAAVDQILANLTPDSPDGLTINAAKLYATYVRPAIGEAVRESISPHRANDVNDKREEILGIVRKRFVELMAHATPKVVIIHEVNLSNLDFPDEMDHANVERAVQGVLKDKAIAERERVEAEIKTAEMRIKLSEMEGAVVAAKIDKIGEALKRNPDFLSYDLQSKMPEIYKDAGAKGNMVIAAPSPVTVMTK